MLRRTRYDTKHERTLLREVTDNDLTASRETTTPRVQNVNTYYCNNYTIVFIVNLLQIMGSNHGSPILRSSKIDSEGHLFLYVQEKFAS